MTDEQYELHKHLSSARYARDNIKRLDEEIQFLRQGSVSAINYDDMPKGSGSTTSVQDKIMDKIARLEAKKKEQVLIVAEISTQIHALENPEMLCMVDYYVRGLKWEEVAEENHIDIRTVYRYRNKSLKILLENKNCQ